MSPRRLELLERRLRGVRSPRAAREATDVWVRFHGALDAFDVQTALDDVARGHALPHELVLRLIDVSDLPPDEAEAFAARRFGAAGDGPRAVLFRLAAGAYALALAPGDAAVDAAALRAAVDGARARRDTDVAALSDADVDALLTQMQTAEGVLPVAAGTTAPDVDELSDDEVDALLRTLGASHA